MILWVIYVIFEFVGVYYKRQMTNVKILMTNEAQMTKCQTIYYNLSFGFHLTFEL
jgi:hypothetical protein